MGSPAIFAGARTKFLTAGGIEIPNRTTAQRDALTAVQGQTIYNSDTDSIEYWDGAAWKSLNQFNLANRNYFSDGNAQDISKFDLYNDGGATPTDGIGGTLTTPNPITKSLNTSTPIISTSSYRFSKPAFNRQGEGWSITTDIALDAPVLEGEPITVQFRYRTSANFAAGDVKMFVYLVGPNTVQALTGIRNDGVYTNELGATGGSIGQFTGTTNATATTTAIRVIGHIASTSTLTYDIDIDDITIGTSATLTAPIVTDWVSYTPQWTAAVTNPTIGNGTLAGRWRRVGDSIEAQIQVTAGATTTFGSGEYRFSLPSGLTFDTTKSTNPGNGDNSFIGHGKIVDLASQVYPLQVERATANTFRPRFYTTATGTNPVNIYTTQVMTPSQPFTFGNGDIVILNIFAPIAEFANATNIISSTQAQFQSGAFRASRNGVDQTGVNPNNSTVKINFNSVGASTDYQRGGLIYDSANSRFVATRPIRLNVSARATASGANILNNRYLLTIAVNGATRVAGDSVVPIAGTAFNLTASGNLNLLTNDIVEVFLLGVGDNSVNTFSVSGVAVSTYFEGQEIPDLSVVGISGAPMEVLSATSAAKTPVASGHFHAHTGNSLTLQPGIWRLRGKAHLFNNGSSPGYTRSLILFGTSNGADSTVEPSFSGITILDGSGIITYGHDKIYTTGAYQEEITHGPEIIISITSTKTVFVNTLANMSTPANARIRVQLVAERIR